MPIKIFISHSAADEALAAAVVDCLESCMVLEDDEVRCTSVPGHKLPVGSDFTAALLEDIGESSVVVGLITRSALSSSWVLFELGATWGARKNLKPIVSDEVDLKGLPGSVSGQHVARLSSSSDVAQFVEEVSSVVGAKRRSAAKTERAIQDLVSAHAKHVEEAATGDRDRSAVLKGEEPHFAGIPFSELVRLLNKELVTVPSELNAGKGDKEVSLFELFVVNARTVSGGVQSNWDRKAYGGFCYHEVGLRLLPYGFVEFEKVPSAHAVLYKRLVVSSEGQRFILEVKRALAHEK